MLFGLFSKMRAHVHDKVRYHAEGVLIDDPVPGIVFPVVFAFLITFSLSRVFSHFFPQLFIRTANGTHIHHFAYGFCILAISGYLALVFNGPKAKYLIALLHGFGLGLAFDEFGMWLRLRDDDPARWSYDGFMLIVGAFLLILSARAGIGLLRRVWPFNTLEK